MVAVPPLEGREGGCAPVKEGGVATEGDKAERATRTAALASRNCASACKTFWLEMPTCSSSALSAGSPKISHHLPRMAPSLGCASFQPAGGASLKVCGATAAGRWYGGTLRQPAESSARASRAASDVRARRADVAQALAPAPARTACR